MNKITLGNDCGGIETLEINFCFGSKSLGNDYGGVENCISVCRTLGFSEIVL